MFYGTNQAGSITGDDRVGWNIFRHHRGAAHDGAVADVDALENTTTRADPDIVADDHGPYLFRRHAFTIAAPGGIHWMPVIVKETGAAGNEAVVTDADFLGDTETALVADEGVIANAQFWVETDGRVEGDANLARDVDIIADDNSAATTYVRNSLNA